MTAPIPVLEHSLLQTVESLPAPFNIDRFHEWRKGVYEQPDLSVYINEQKDFAFLYPQPSFDYSHYQSRVKRLSLGEYSKKNDVTEKRFEKIGAFFAGNQAALEIGSADAAFLRRAKDANSALRLASLEPDAETKSARDSLSWLRQYKSFDAILEHEDRFDIVCFFHVLEHIAKPGPFLEMCAQVLLPKGRLFIEVPSMDDPLLSLYHVKAYEDFYFQTQHPYVYTARSLARLLQANGWEIENTIPHQRYGLENHLTWLAKGRPGGDEELRGLFGGLDVSYRQSLEKRGFTDAILMSARKR